MIFSKRILVPILTLCCALFSVAQEGINYQAIIKDASGVRIANQSVSMRVSIIYDSASGATAYAETHTTNTTVDGLVNFVVGTGTQISGVNFENIQWSRNALFIKNEVDTGGGYVDLGTYQLRSVPFAYYAKNSGGTSGLSSIYISSGAISATSVSLSGAIAAASASITGTLTAGAFVGDGSGLTGISTGTDSQTLSLSGNVLSISSGNSVTLSTSSSNTDSQTLTISGTILSISNGNQVTLPSSGGSSLDGVTASAGVISAVGANFSANITATAFYGDGSNLTGIVATSTISESHLDAFGNAFIDDFPSGLSASNTEGNRNTGLGSGILTNITTGNNNVAVGHNTLEDLTTGYQNVAIGSGAIKDLTTGRHNVGIGSSTLANISTGRENTAVGSNAMPSATGNQNTAIGFESLKALTSGSSNNALGRRALQQITTGSNNTGLGDNTGYYVTTGSNNTFVGQWASSWGTNISDGVAVGKGSQTGNRSVSIGQNAIASSDDSVVIGDDASSADDAGIVIGRSAFANSAGTSSGSIAIGYDTYAGSNDIVIGKNSRGGSNMVVIGSDITIDHTNGSNTGYNSVVLGTESLLSKNSRYSVIIGSESKVGSATTSSDFHIGAITVGAFSEIQGDGSTGAIAMGYDATASNQFTVALGYGATTSGQAAVGIGPSTTSSGAQAVSLGYLSQATGQRAVSLGYFARATASNAVAIGEQTANTTANSVVIGGSSTTSWAFGRNQTIHAFQVGSTSSNGNGAYLTDGGTWTNASSIAFKTNFVTLSNAWILEKIKGLNISKWDYKNTSETHIGPIAEEFTETFEVGVAGENEHLSTVDVSGVALKGVQALIEENEALKAQIQMLMERMEAFEKQLQQ